MWRECTFVLDANILLNLYRYRPEERDQFLAILSKLKERIWLPHQAAREYQRNRLKVIQDQHAAYERSRSFSAPWPTTLNRA